MKRNYLFALGMTFLFTSCNSNAINNVKLLRTPIEGETSDPRDLNSEGYVNFTNKINDFSSKFSSEFYKNYFVGDENLALSPLSLYMSMALVVSCGSNSAKQEILDALKMDENELRKYSKLLYNYSNKEYLDYYKEVYCKEKITNSIWFDKSIAKNLKGSKLDDLAENFYCYPYEVDFNRKNDKANAAIKEFIKQSTDGFIDQSLEISPTTLMVLLNTLFFKDSWNISAQDLPTSENTYQFLNHNGSITETKLLNGYYNPGKTYETDSYKCFYTSTYNSFFISFIVPKDENKIEDIFTYETIRKASDRKYILTDEEKLERYYTKCIFPEFNASCDTELKDFLVDSFNIKEVFYGSNSFSDIYDGDLVCDSVKHITKVEVDKKGVKGAAVTSWELSSSASSPDPEYKNIYEDFLVDRNFGFIISDYRNTPLFTGVVNKI